MSVLGTGKPGKNGRVQGYLGAVLPSLQLDAERYARCNANAVTRQLTNNTDLDAVRGNCHCSCYYKNKKLTET